MQQQLYMQHFDAACPQIADFGMSRIMEKSADPTDTVTMGTVTHMPPELLMECKLSPAADVYAFGAPDYLC